MDNWHSTIDGESKSNQNNSEEPLMIQSSMDNILFIESTNDFTQLKEQFRLQERELSNQIEFTRKQLYRLVSELAQKTSQLNAKEKKLQSLENTTLSQTNSIDELKSLILKSETEKEILHNKINSLELNLQSLKEDKILVVESYKRQSESQREMSLELEKKSQLEIENLRIKINQFEEDIEKQKFKHNKDLDDTHYQYQTEIENQQETQNLLVEEIKRLNQDIINLSEKNLSLESQLAISISPEVIKDYESQLRANEKERDNLRSKLQSLKTVEYEFEEFKKASEARIQEIKIQAQYLHKDLDNLKTLNDSLKKDLEKELLQRNHWSEVSKNLTENIQRLQVEKNQAIEKLNLQWEQKLSDAKKDFEKSVNLVYEELHQTQSSLIATQEMVTHRDGFIEKIKNEAIQIQMDYEERKSTHRLEIDKHLTDKKNFEQKIQEQVAKISMLEESFQRMLTQSDFIRDKYDLLSKKHEEQLLRSKDLQRDNQALENQISLMVKKAHEQEALLDATRTEYQKMIEELKIKNQVLNNLVEAKEIRTDHIEHDLMNRKNELHLQESRLKAYSQAINRKTNHLSQHAYYLLNEYQTSETQHPLQDYLDFTESELKKIEVQLQKTPMVSLDRGRLENAFAQLIEQREFLKKVVDERKNQMALRAKDLQNFIESTKLTSVPPPPPPLK